MEINLNLVKVDVEIVSAIYADNVFEVKLLLSIVTSVRVAVALCISKIPKSGT